MNKIQSPSSPSSEPTDSIDFRGYGLLKKSGLIAGPVGAGLILLLGHLLIAAEASGMARPALHTLALAWWMACWWLTEAVPIAVTALLPIVLIPLLGISPIKVATAPYAHPLVMLFMGGFIIGIAMQRHQLHRRIALHIVARAGHSDRMLVAGVMVAAAFLSMWIMNTATTMMLLPIGIALIDYQQSRGIAGRQLRNFSLCLLLGIAYGATLGGVATLIGTAPNGFIAAFMLETYALEISFVQWLQVGLPISLLLLVVTWGLLTWVVYPPRVTGGMGESEYILGELENLGRMNQAEKVVAAVFVSAALLWVSRASINAWLPGLQLTDAGIAMSCALVLFLIPLDWSQGEFVLRWEDLKALPWGVLILFGGGLSLAAAVSDSGLSLWFGEQLAGLGGWPLPLLTFTVVAVVILLTELSSNTATTAILLPLIAALAVA
ncbi:MAG: DASS family sodium-coupled anion symporter, partial [Gammaproteobacteria bacterium]